MREHCLRIQHVEDSIGQEQTRRACYCASSFLYRHPARGPTVVLEEAAAQSGRWSSRVVSADEAIRGSDVCDHLRPKGYSVFGFTLDFQMLVLAEAAALLSLVSVYCLANFAVLFNQMLFNCWDSYGNHVDQFCDVSKAGRDTYGGVCIVCMLLAVFLFGFMLRRGRQLRCSSSPPVARDSSIEHVSASQC